MKALLIFQLQLDIAKAALTSAAELADCFEDDSPSKDQDGIIQARVRSHLGAIDETMECVRQAFSQMSVVQITEDGYNYLDSGSYYTPNYVKLPVSEQQYREWLSRHPQAEGHES